MAYRDIAIVNVNLQTATAQGADFGTQLFIGAHARFRERVRTYTSLTAAATDFETTSNEYKALQAAFSQNPPPPQMKIGRMNSTTTLTPTGVADGSVHTVRVEVNEADFVLATFTAGAVDTAETVATALKAAIDGNALVAAHVTTAVVGAGAAGTLTIVATTPATDEYSISGLVGLTESYTTSETAADALSAIENVDDGFAFVTAYSHVEAFVLAMAAAIETRKKLYFVSSQDELVLATLATPATDIFGKLTDLNYLRTVTFYNQAADTTFPECAFIAKWSGTTPGTEQWSIKTLAGVASSTALNGGSTPVPLSATQKGNLDARNTNFIDTQRGLDIVYGGKVAAGTQEWIDVVRFRDYVEDQTEISLFNLKYNMQKVPYDNDGINSIQGACTTVWDRFTSRPGQPKGLVGEKPYTLSFPTAAQVSATDKTNREYKPSATLFLSGAITLTTLTINLTYPTE